MRRFQHNRALNVGAILIALSLVIGAQLGIWLSRRVGPVRLSGIDVADLSAEQQEAYVILVAADYARTRDLDMAIARLERLDLPNASQWLANLTDRYITEGRDEADIQALVTLSNALGVTSSQMMAWLPTSTPRPTHTPPPTATPVPTFTPTASSIPPTAEPTMAPPTDTPQPPATDTPTNEPSATPTETPAPPTDTPQPQPSNTPRPRPSNTPKPTNPPAPTWSWTARLVGPGSEGQECDGGGNQMIRVTVLGPGGNPLSGVAVYEGYSGQYRLTGHKGDDPFWGPGDAEFSSILGGRVCIASAEGGDCVSDFTRDLPCHDPPPVDDLWTAGYCECWEAGITKEQCQQNLESGKWSKIGHYYWRVEFKRSQ